MAAQHIPNVPRREFAMGHFLKLVLAMRGHVGGGALALRVWT